MLIRREALAAAVQACGEDERGYALSCVQIEPNHRAVSTNGHVLIVATDKSPIPDEDFPSVPGAPFKGSPEKPTLVPAETIKRLVQVTKPSGRGYHIPCLGTVQLSTNGSPESVTVAATDLKTPTVAHVDPPAARFPAYDRIVPKDDRQVLKLMLSRQVLETLIGAVRAAHGSAKHQYGGVLTFEVPIAPEYQDYAYDDKAETKTANGVIASAVRVTYTGLDVDLDMVAMPCRK